jgi:hypothetical protein
MPAPPIVRGIESLDLSRYQGSLGSNTYAVLSTLIWLAIGSDGGEGSFPGMVATRKLNIVLATEGATATLPETLATLMTVDYSDKAVTGKFRFQPESPPCEGGSHGYYHFS